MGGLSHRAILVSYAVLLLLTVILMLFFGSHSSLPLPTDRALVGELKTTLSDPELKQAYGDEISVTRERLRRMTELSTNAFSTVLGALIGFLSASWTRQNGPPKEHPETARTAVS